MRTGDLAAAELGAQLTALRPELHRYCARLMGSVIEGEDVVQDACLRVLAGFDSGTPLRPWLFRIAHNRAIDVLRGRARRRTEPMEAAFAVADDTTADPAQSLIGKEAVGMAIARFSELPVMPRSVVILKDVLGESLAYIATLLDLSIDAVKGHLARGRARLRALSSQPAPDIRPRTASPETARYIDLFNARDWDALRALLASDAKLQQSAYPLRSGPSVRDFFGIYAGYSDVGLAPGWIDGREVIAVFEGPAQAPSHIMWLDWQDGLIHYIRDYRYVPYVLAEARLVM